MRPIACGRFVRGLGSPAMALLASSLHVNIGPLKDNPGAIAET